MPDAMPDNPKLVDLSGLEYVTTIGGALQITNNVNLLSLHGLEGLSALNFTGTSLADVFTASCRSLPALCIQTTAMPGWQEQESICMPFCVHLGGNLHLA